MIPKQKVGTLLADSSYFYVVQTTDRQTKLEDAKCLVFGEMSILNPNQSNENYIKENCRIVILSEFGISADAPQGFTKTTIDEIHNETISDEMLNEVIWAACEADELFYGE